MQITMCEGFMIIEDVPEEFMSRYNEIHNRNLNTEEEREDQECDLGDLEVEIVTKGFNEEEADELLDLFMVYSLLDVGNTTIIYKLSIGKEG